jgi:hypothetical protein
LVYDEGVVSIAVAESVADVSLKTEVPIAELLFRERMVPMAMVEVLSDG